MNIHFTTGENMSEIFSRFGTFFTLYKKKNKFRYYLNIDDEIIDKIELSSDWLIVKKDIRESWEIALKEFQVNKHEDAGKNGTNDRARIHAR